MGPLSVYILIANTVWDLVSALSICMRDAGPKCMAVANVHLALWVEESDRTNPAAAMLFVFLLIHWSYFRALSALIDWKELALWTYVMEATLFLSQWVAGRMHPRLAAGATAMCALAMIAIVSDI